MNWNRRIATLAGLALLALTNAVALGGAAWNRSGEPDATLRLTERELDPPYNRSDRNENSGMALRITWRTLSKLSSKPEDVDLASDGGSLPAWLDARKMSALGFQLPPAHRHPPADDGERARWQPSRQVLIVLELDGPARQEAMRRAEAHAVNVSQAKGASVEDKKDAQATLAQERVSRSRLFAIDAGLDAAALRARYPDRTTYAIVRGRIDSRLYGEGGQAQGSIESLGADVINVPLAWHAFFDGLGRPHDSTIDETATHFQATVAFGQRLEPWLVAAARR